jgi:2-iminobutanoate/2-iminopropanoate deaminase
MKTPRNPSDVHAPLAAYSHQIEVSGERLLVISGQVGIRPDGTFPGDVLEQLRVALDNLGSQLDAAGMAVSDLVKLNYYFVGPTDPSARARVISGFLGEHRPCSTLVNVSSLAALHLLVEVEAWAAAS